MSRTALNMKKLIEKTYYTDGETATQKLDLLMLASRITDEEYTSLIMMIESVYTPLAEPALRDIGTGAEPKTPVGPVPEVA